MNILRRIWMGEDSDDQISLCETKEFGWSFWFNDEWRVDMDMATLSHLAVAIRKIEKEAK